MTLRLWFLTLILIMMGISVTAQEETPLSGSGVIVESNADGQVNTDLNPLNCLNRSCTHITHLLYPTLYAADPLTRYPITAAPDNTALVVSAEAEGENTQRLTLRDDLLWSDGTPVTAYDVLYSYQAINRGYSYVYWREIPTAITAARLIDEHTIEFAYPQVDCTLEFTGNFPVIPAHVFDPTYAEQVDAYEGAEDILDYQEAWFETYLPENFGVLYSTQATVTLAAPYHLDSLVPFEEIRVASQDGAQAYILRDLPSGLNAVEAFMAGDANLLVNPPYTDRADLAAYPDVQISQYPSLTKYYITLNLADRNFPENAFDEEGEAIDQGFHHIFGDVRVRKAFQHSIDVHTLIDIAFQGYGVPLASSQIPASWAYDETLVPVPFDFTAAEGLLYEAGWRDIDSDGIRECSGCLYAEEGQDLYFEMIYPNEMEAVANYIVRQMREVGADVLATSLHPEGINEFTLYQTYDAALVSVTESFPVNPDQTKYFTRAADRADIAGFGGNTVNTGSYYNPRIEELMEQARTLPGCDIAERAAIYREIDAILQEDQPYIWLFAPLDMVVASGGILGFDPLRNQPFWNIRDWVIVQ